MLPRLSVANQRQTATKRVVLCCGFVGLSFLAIACFGLHQRIHVSESILPHRQVSATPTKIQPKLVASYGKLPLSFEANQGQTDPRVRFLARGGGYTIFLTDDEAVLTLKESSVVSGQSSVSARVVPTGTRADLVGRPADARVAQHPLFGAAALPDLLSLSMPEEKSDSEVERPRDRRAGPALPFSSSRRADSGESSGVLRMRLIGANAKAIVTGAGELLGKSNYFIGNDPRKWRTNVPSYARVKYEGVYPGVDLVYYGNQRQLEYDFVVAPGADPNQIKLSFAGADGMRVDVASGDLVLKMGEEEVRFQKPAVYQPAVFPVPSSSSPSVASPSGPDARHSSLVTRHCSFVLAGNDQVAFRVAGYDPKRALVIDPVLSYSTYLGGSGNDEGLGIAVDSAGNAYVTGGTSSTDFPTVNPIQSSIQNMCSYGACGAVFVAKLNPAGSALVYSTYLGGGRGDQGYGIAVDSAGNAYVTGMTFSTDFPTVNPLQATNKAAAYTAFVAKLNPAGSALVYSTYLGGSGDDWGRGIAVDTAGNAYVTGMTISTDFPTVNPLQATSKTANYTAFVAKLNPAGSALIYSTYLGGSIEELALGIAADAAGNAYATGTTCSSDFPTANSLQASLASACSAACFGGDAFVSKLNSAGSALVYSTYLGGSSCDIGQGIAVDAAGNAYVTGVTESSDFPTANPLQSSLSGSSNAFVAKLNPAGSALAYSTYLGGSPGDSGYGIAADNAGNAYVTGWTSSTNFPTANAPQPSYGGGEDDAFVAMLNPAGSALVYSTYLGGSGGDGGEGIAVDAAGNAYVTGQTSSTDFPTVNPLQATNNASTSLSPSGAYGMPGGTGFVAKLIPAPAVTLSTSTLAFGSVLVGTTTPAQSVVLTNIGGAPLNLTITSIVASGDFAQTNNCAGSVAPTASCTVNVSFTPTAPGNRTGALTLTDNASNSPQTVTLSGTGLGATASLSASTLVFSTSQLVGTTSSAQQVTLQNAGNQALGITSISLTGADSGDFSLSQNCGNSLGANASCQISVTFTPTARGARTATVSLVDNVSDSPQSISLSGTGIAPVANLSPSSLTFSGQFVGTTGLPQNITLTNNGDVPLSISSIQASAQFGTSNGCTTSLAVGVGCTISVFFDPSAAGSQTGTLTITDNAPGSPQTVQLSGTGMDFAMSSPATSQTVAAGQTATYPLTLAPEGGLTQTVSLTCSGAPSLSTCTLTPGSVALNGTASAPVTVTVSTTAGSLAPPLGKVSPPSITGLGRMFWLYALLGLASVGALAAARKRRAAYLLGACLLMVMLWSACGGGAQVVHTPGTPAGTYTLDVSATVTSAATSSKLTHDLKLTLTVD